MLHRERTLPPVYIYPVNEWKIVKKQFDLDFLSQIPEALEGFRFPLTIRGQELEVNIEKDQVTYLLRKGSELVLTHWGKNSSCPSVSHAPPSSHQELKSDETPACVATA